MHALPEALHGIGSGGVGRLPQHPRHPRLVLKGARAPHTTDLEDLAQAPPALEVSLPVAGAAPVARPRAAAVPIAAVLLSPSLVDWLGKARGCACLLADKGSDRERVHARTKAHALPRHPLPANQVVKSKFKRIPGGRVARRHESRHTHGLPKHAACRQTRCTHHEYACPAAPAGAHPALALTAAAAAVASAGRHRPGRASRLGFLSRIAPHAWVAPEQRLPPRAGPGWGVRPGLRAAGEEAGQAGAAGAGRGGEAYHLLIIAHTRHTSKKQQDHTLHSTSRLETSSRPGPRGKAPTQEAPPCALRQAPHTRRHQARPLRGRAP